MKKYDLVVFGASGFTGRLIVDYLSNHQETSKLNWAVAGRSESKLKKEPLFSFAIFNGYSP